MKIYRFLFTFGYVFLLSFQVFAQSEAANLQKILDHMIAQNGQITYSAIYALPETRKDFTDVMGEKSWMSFFPEHLYEQISDSQKDLVVTLLVQDLITLNKVKRTSVLNRLQNWISLFEILSSAEHMSSKEQVMAAVYANPVTQSLFSQALKSRDWQKANPTDIVTSLSSGEMAIIQYRLLENLLEMKRIQQIQYFQGIFDYIFRDYKNW